MTRRVDIADPKFSAEDRARIHTGLDAILSGQLSMGPNVRAFEGEFAKLSGASHAVAVNACTSALEIALTGLGLKPGDEVIVPALTFIATGMAVHLNGGVPVFAEISEDSLCLDLDDVKKRVTARTRGVIVVYFAGLIPPDIAELVDFCRKKNLFLIEDAAHAPGAKRSGARAGTWGDAGCFSFFPTKVMTAGEGGMLTTNDAKLAGIARSLQNRGRDMEASAESYALPGRNVRMTELAALLGRVQLSHLEDNLALRRFAAAAYKKALSKEKRVKLIVADEPSASSCWKLPLLVAPGIDRDAVTKTLREAGVQCDTGYYPPLHLQPVFKKLLKTKDGLLPKSEELLKRLICLPCHPGVSQDDVEHVVAALKSGLERA